MKTKQNRKLILSVTKKDCRWDYYRGHGSGGQKKNKTSNCVRCTHIDSGAVGKSENGRSQIHNKKTAFTQMAESKKFKAWLRIESARIQGREHEIEHAVERSMHSKNIKVETKNEKGKWVENNT